MTATLRQRGALAMLMALVLALFASAALVSARPPNQAPMPREAVTHQALARAKEALVAFAASRPVDGIVGPGYLPCPDLDNDGWAESTCGSLSGDTGQERRLGRLPWKTLGLPDLRDADGERLWYAVSSKQKGLLNCETSPGCIDMSPEAALGTITVRDAAGNLLHDGTSTSLLAPSLGGALAVVIAPGAPILRWGGSLQRRLCEAGQCAPTGQCLTEPPMKAAKCAPENYLDRSPDTSLAAEDNARFIDRNDSAGRPLNRDGFIRGPITDARGTWVNDRLLAVTYDDVMPGVMRRVAEEVAACLKGYQQQAGHAGRTPWPTPMCRAGSPNSTLRWADARNVAFGRIPDTPFSASRESSGGSLSRLWPAAEGCHLADNAGATSSLSRFTWWSAWKRHVFYAVAGPGRPDGSAQLPCDSITCLVVSPPDVGAPSRPGHRVAVLVAGHPLRWDGFEQLRGPGADEDARHWLEGSNTELRRLNDNPPAPDCAPDPSLALGPGNPGAIQLALDRRFAHNDIVVAIP